MTSDVANFKGYLDTPIGILELNATESGLRTVKIVPEKGPENLNKFIHYYKHTLASYFDGAEVDFVDYFDFEGYTDFYKQVWKKLTEIPMGTVISYKTLAEQIQNPKAVRAVALANSKNPIPIIIPCHRVIGSDGSLTGYALGLNVKRELLLHEKYLPPELF